MEVRDVRVEESALGADRVRLRAEVRYGMGAVGSEEYWFDVPRARASELSTSGNPWLATLLPLAAHTGEPLRLSLPVDQPLLENAGQLMRIWQTWYPEVSVVPIEAEVASSAGDSRPSRAAAFFSGGVDSFFTVLRCRTVAPPVGRAPIDDLMTVWGFDIPLAQRDAFLRLRERHERVATELGKPLIDVATNLRTTRWSSAQWSYLAHGPGFAGVALALERRFHTVYLAGSGSYRDFHPWASHPVTDPLFSTSHTSIVFDAAEYLRTDKIERIAESATALRNLRVCFETQTDENCGHCGKCQRTMLVLALCGALERSATFPRTTIDLRQIARMDCSHPFALREVQDIRRLAVAKGRSDVVAALDRSAARSARRRLVRAGIAGVRRPVGALVRRFRGDR
jgi:hypothetical protein